MKVKGRDVEVVAEADVEHDRAHELILAVERYKLGVMKLTQKSEEEEEENEVPIAYGISPEEYTKFVSKLMKKLGQNDDQKLYVQLSNDGTIILYEVPVERHQAAAFELFSLLRPPLAAAGHGRAQSGALTMLDPGLAGAQILSDGYFIPTGLAVGGAVQARNAENKPWPTLILEVGFSQTPASLLRKINQKWFHAGTSVQIVLVIKFWRAGANGNTTMIAMRFERGLANPTYVVSFGTANLHGKPCWGGAPCVGVGCGGPACNAPGLAMYQLRIPTASLFFGLPAGVPAGLGAFVQVDLFPLQQYILSTDES